MNYYVADCMTGGPYNRRHEYAITKDMGRRYIHEDKEGHKFFYVTNKVGKPFIGEKHMYRSLFNGRIKDAIDTIRNGDAHTLYGSKNIVNVFDSEPAPIWLLDEDLGEKYRKQTLEGFKDSVFGYSVKFGSKNSFSPGRFINKEGTSICMDREDVPAFFEEEQDAYDFMMKLYNKACEEVENIRNGANSDDVCENYKENFLLKSMIFDILLKYEDEKESEYEEENTTYLNDWKLNNYYIEMVQSIKPVN